MYPALCKCMLKYMCTCIIILTLGNLFLFQCDVNFINLIIY